MESDKTSSPLSDRTNTIAAAGRRKLSLRSAVSAPKPLLKLANTGGSLAPSSSLKSNTSVSSNNSPLSTTSAECNPSSLLQTTNYSPLTTTSAAYGRAKSPHQVQRQDNHKRKDKGKINVQLFTVESPCLSTPTSLHSSSSAAVSGTSGHLTPKFGVTYTRRTAAKTKYRREKSIVVHYSCPPGKRQKDTGDKLDDDGGDAQSGIHTDPIIVPKKQSRLKSKVQGSMHAMPKEELEMLKAYYADIDAFDLPVEEADDSDLD